MKITDIVHCVRTKAKVCECAKIKALNESDHTINAVVQLEHTEGNIKGYIILQQEPDNPTVIKGKIQGLSPGKHGFHIHEFGDLSKGCESAGGHYNPEGVDHGDLENGHVGDLGNIIADQNGTANFEIKASRVNLSGDQSVVGRAIVIHADEDDLGKGGDDESLKTGNAGNRLACGVIRLQE